MPQGFPTIAHGYVVQYLVGTSPGIGYADRLKSNLAFATFFGTSLVSRYFPALNLHLDDRGDRTLQAGYILPRFRPIK
jgi:hypothetical protein